MSLRPHPLRQSQTVDCAVLRQPSNASSSASSGYYSNSSGAFEFGRASAISSPPTSLYSNQDGAPSHRRGKSEASRLPPASVGGSDSQLGRPMSPDKLYHAARQGLRPLPQVPAENATSVPRPAPSPYQGLSRVAAIKKSNGHERGQSLDLSRLTLVDDEPPASPSNAATARPRSMVLTRSDSAVRRGSDVPSGVHAATVQHSMHATSLGTGDLEKLAKSSTNQLRNLSRLAQSEGADAFAITSPEQEVVGLRGRRRLKRSHQGHQVASRRTGGYGWEGRNWMDKQRQFLQAYEYLCHIGEAKEWMEDVIQRPMPPIVELEETLRDGVALAEVVEALNPDGRFRIFRHPRLQFRHSDNIAIFFRYLDEVELPDLFRFELIDVYEKKNMPKVIYCLHALSWLLYRKGIVDFRMGNLVGQLEFEHHELEAMQKGLDKLGTSMPSFGTMRADFGVELEAEPEETEEERIEGALAEAEGTVVDLQAQARAALVRMRLGVAMDALWSWEKMVVDMQARIRGDWTRQVTWYRLDMRRFAVRLQSAARGFLARRCQAGEAAWRRATEVDVLRLQSSIRAGVARREVRELRSQLDSKGGLLARDIQAAARGFLARRAVTAQQREARRAGPTVTGLQAAARGALIRRAVQEEKRRLRGKECEASVTGLQAAVRALLTRRQMAAQRKTLDSFAPHWRALQAVMRGGAARDGVHTVKTELRQHEAAVGRLQAAMRAAGVRREVAETLDGLAMHEEGVAELQTSARGCLLRLRVAKNMDALRVETASITNLQSRARAFLHRKQQQHVLDELDSHEDLTTAVQSFARAMLLRGRVASLLELLDEHEEAITEVQARARGCMVRTTFAQKRRHFAENMQKVVKIQSFVRAKLQGEAYKSLTTGRNPPVGAVKNFVHLLNDSDFDFNEEVEFERLRKTAVQQVRQNETLEQYIDQLDIKIALLVKNKITLDEVLRLQSTFGGHAPVFPHHHFDLKALNKSSRQKLELYQQLFFILQTQGQYLARLFVRVREAGMAETECKRLEHLVMGLFGYAQKRREEYYLLRLMGRSVHEEVARCATVQDYLRGTFFWARLLANYSRSPRDRRYLRDLLGPLVRDHIVEDPQLDLESDPAQIYRAAISNEELRTGRPSQRPPDVPRELAIKDPETRALFIDHLRDLREICDQFLLAFEDRLPRMPYGLRFVCRTMHEALCRQFPREPPDALLLHGVGAWLWRFYLQPAVMAPEKVGVTERQLGPLQRRNLAEVAKVLGQMASGRPFGGDNVYLQPLNAFLSDSVERLSHILGQLVAVPDAEETFDIDEYNDLYAKNRPTLYVKTADVFALHQTVAAELACLCPKASPTPGDDQVLRELVQDLGSPKSNEVEMTAQGSSDMHMVLTPRLHDVPDPEAEVKALFMETKRCVLYIIRVQTGANLLEILVKPVGPEDELKWAALLRDDFSQAKGAYSDVNMADVTRMSYPELKRTALENVMRLERMGRISKHNCYQDVLNAIALDIRTKSRRRVQRQRELEGVRLTLGNLHDKAAWLEQQRKSYDDYIEQAMATLQNKNTRRRFLLPFTRQYNHQRELERAGRVPRFGSYKYSARALSDRGVLVAWRGVPDRDWGHINLTISCDEVGVFALEGSRGHVQMPGASALVPVEDLLQAQFETHQFMTLFEGNLRLNVNLLLHLLFKKFYRTQ